ncbi:MAG: SUMF1/EgtB/PvdO family nonheme iron enzyme [Candidatus Latescibacterota bacterium]|nr:SUMF1/EgtB/PvdO family nonheme iron enzyme [Candidatus Latescibacterota bacterium]
MRHQKKYSLSVTALIIIFSCSAPPAPPTANLRPIAEAGPNQSVAIRSLVVINGGNSTDPDEGPDPLAYAWKAAESNPTEVVVSMSGAKFEFTPIKTGNYVFVLTVTDGQIESIPDSIVITVSYENDIPPIADAGPDLIVGIGASVPLSGINSNDPSGNELSFLWRVVESPEPLALLDSTSAQLTFIAEFVGEYRFQLAVDNGKFTSQDQINITVQPAANLPPIADAGEDQQVRIGSLITLNGNLSSDPDGTVENLEFRWSVGRTPSGLISLDDSTSAQPSFVANQAGEYSFGLQVSDGESTSLQDVVSVTVFEPTANEFNGMIEVFSGNFIMGSTSGASDETPPHSVSLSTFWIDKFEVSVQDYQECVKTGKCSPAGLSAGCNTNYSDRADHPINCVDWDQANTYCTWRQKRLPTEAEWEYSARGRDNRLYPWGNEAPNPTLLNYNNLIGGTTVIGTFPLGVTYFKVYNMGGNVQEWTNDLYSGDYYASSPEKDPQGPNDGSLRVVRGASWKLGILQEVLTTTVRFAFVPTTKDNSLGFRCASNFSPAK